MNVSINGLPGSDREFSALTGRSGTHRAQQSGANPRPNDGWQVNSSARLPSFFPIGAAGAARPRAAPDVGVCSSPFFPSLLTRRLSRSRPEAHAPCGLTGMTTASTRLGLVPACASPVRRWSPVTARTVQGMARVWSGQAPAWLLVSDRSVRRGSGVQRDFACTFPRHLDLCALPCGHSHA
jgi:hypothetical protein